MPNELPYMRLWVDDLMSDPDVYGMSVDEFGAYLRLLCVAWRKGSIPSDEAACAKAIGVTPRRFSRLWETVGQKWESNGNGGLVNPRQERERAEATELHRRRVKAGRKGGQSKAKAEG